MSSGLPPCFETTAAQPPQHEGSRQRGSSDAEDQLVHLRQRKDRLDARAAPRAQHDFEHPAAALHTLVHAGEAEAARRRADADAVVLDDDPQGLSRSIAAIERDIIDAD